MPDDSSQHRHFEQPPHTASDAIPHVPKSLLDELHHANEEFSASRHEREDAMDAPSYSTMPASLAREHVTEAEKQVEAVTEKIDNILKAAPTTPDSLAKSD